MTILLIDDDPEIRHLAGFVLEAAGHTVRMAGSGAEGLAQVDELRPDTILLDVLLPDADGTALIGRLRSVPGIADVPVIFLTGRSGPDDLATLEAAGCDGVITKPFDPTLLAETVARLSVPASREEAP